MGIMEPHARGDGGVEWWSGGVVERAAWNPTRPGTVGHSSHDSQPSHWGAGGSPPAENARQNARQNLRLRRGGVLF